MGYYLEAWIATARERGATVVHLTAGAAPRVRIAGGPLELFEPAPDSAPQGFAPGFVIPTEDLLFWIEDVLDPLARQRLIEFGEVEASLAAAPDDPAGVRPLVSVYRTRGRVSAVVHFKPADLPPAPRHPSPAEHASRTRVGLPPLTGVSPTFAPAAPPDPSPDERRGAKLTAEAARAAAAFPADPFAPLPGAGAAGDAHSTFPMPGPSFDPGAGFLDSLGQDPFAAPAPSASNPFATGTTGASGAAAAPFSDPL